MDISDWDEYYIKDQFEKLSDEEFKEFINQTNEYGENALWNADSYFTELLIKYGIDTHIVNIKGECVYDIVYDDRIKELIDNSPANIKSKSAMKR